MPTWTQEQIISLAPDPASAKAGRELAYPRKWQNAGHNDRALWGEHQGSGSKPYLTSIDLEEPAFKCTCPSRKFPCKHGLGLFLAFANDSAAFPSSTPPQWAAEWLASRAEKEERDAKREERKEQEANDPEAKAKAEKTAARSAAQRKSRVDKGIEDLDRWLCDLIRGGFAQTQIRSYQFWDAQAARLVDAQVPGLARRVRNMSLVAIPSAYPYTNAPKGPHREWHERLLEDAGKLHLLLEAYRRLDTLPEPVQADVRTLIGWTQNQAELLTTEDTDSVDRVTDTWIVVGQQLSIEDQVRNQRTWLWGRNSMRAALILDFAFGNAPFDINLVLHTQFEAEIVYFPSAYPQRALIKDQRNITSFSPGMRAHSIAEAVAEYSRALQRNPWIELFPMLVSGVIPAHATDAFTGKWRLTHIRDAEGNALPVDPNYGDLGALTILARSGGSPIMLFGIWNGTYFYPFTTWPDPAISMEQSLR